MTGSLYKYLKDCLFGGEAADSYTAQGQMHIVSLEDISHCSAKTSTLTLASGTISFGQPHDIKHVDNNH